MATINGTSNGETLDGTADADTIIGLGGIDILNGLDGDDVLDGSPGNPDTLNGGDGNDVLITYGLDGAETYNGGAGTDTLRLGQPQAPTLTPLGYLAPYILAPATISSIERLEFGSYSFNGQPVGTNLAITSLTQYGSGFVSGLELVGSASRDILIVQATASGDYSLPNLVKTNWTEATDAYLLFAPGTQADVVNLVGGSSTSNYTLRATAGHTGVQGLTGNAGNDTLIGTDGMESFTGTTGTDLLQGGGGNDAFFFGNTVTTAGTPGTFNSFAGTTVDGGAGTDTMVFSGTVYFAGTFSGIERIYLQGPVAADATHSFRPETYVDLSEATANQSISSLILDGIGTLSISLSPGQNFNGSGLVIAANSNVTLEIYGSEGNDTIVGSATSDRLDGDDGNDILTGGAGADVFALSLGNDTITDFTVGTDKIDASSVFNSYKTLKSFLHQSGNDVVLQATEGGVVTTFLTVKNVTLAQLTADSFLFGTGGATYDLVATEAADTYIGSNFGDSFSGLGGDDLIITGGGGYDNFDGGSGNDIIVINNMLSANQVSPAYQNVYNGGTGDDTLRIDSFETFNSTVPVPQSLANLTSSTISSIEHLVLNSLAGERMAAALTYAQAQALVAAGTTLSGGAGGDTVSTVVTVAGDYTVSNFTRTNWNKDLSYISDITQVLNSDVVVLQGVGTGAFTLRANTTHAGLEYLIGSSGNDTLYGGNDYDILLGGSGNDQAFGGGGDDILIVNATSTQAGDLYDGGTGTDILSVAGAVSFAGTIQSIEGIRLQLATPTQIFSSINGILTSTISPGTPSSLVINSSAVRQLASNTFLQGAGTITITVDDSGTLDLSGWTYGSDGIAITINGVSANDRLIGTSRADILYGGDGDDVLIGGLGIDRLNGGGGNDRIYYDAADNPDYIQGGEGLDHLVVQGSAALPLDFSLANHGFEFFEREIVDQDNSQNYSSLRNLYTQAGALSEAFTYYDDGAYTHTDYDEGNNQSYVRIDFSYDAAGRLANRQIEYDDGTKSFILYDPANTQSYDQIINAIDAQGRLVNQLTNYDDNSTVSVVYDAAGTQSYSQIVNAGDTLGRLTNQLTSYDNGESVSVIFDAAGTQSYTRIINALDAQGRTVNQVTNYDDGTSTSVVYDAANTQSYSQIINAQDSLGRTVNQVTNYDDGTSTSVVYDAANTQLFTQIINAIDTLGRTTNQSTSYDDGVTVSILYDVANTQTYSQIINTSDALGRLDAQEIRYDNGSHTFIDYDQANSEAWNQHVTEFSVDGTTVIRDYFVI